MNASTRLRNLRGWAYVGQKDYNKARDDFAEALKTSPNDPNALADVFTKLAADPARVACMGEAARARILDGFTERDVMEAVKRVYAAMLAA